MLLDPYIVKSASGVTAVQVLDAFIKIYPDIGVPKESDEASYNENLVIVEAWMQKLRRKPGLALSTGGRNSSKGVLTCALLEALGVDRPKATRTRMMVAWAVLNSPEGRKAVGQVPELEAERELSAHYFNPI